MLNITIYCFKKKSEINVCFLLNTFSFSTLKFNSLSDLIIASPNFSMSVRYFLAIRKGKQHPYGDFLSPVLNVPYTLFCMICSLLDVF